MPESDREIALPNGALLYYDSTYYSQCLVLNAFRLQF
jgi:hypothetical protein